MSVAVDLPPADIHTQPDLVRAPDPADAADAETVIYECGTHAPGLVREPCQHSHVWVLCCSCAGCMNEVWDCGYRTEADSWLWWQREKLKDGLAPLLRNRPFLFFIALAVIWGLVSGAVTMVLWIMYVVTVLSAAGVLFLLAYGLHGHG